MSIVQGPFSVAPCQTLASRFATFSSQYRADTLLGAGRLGRLVRAKELDVVRYQGPWYPTLLHKIRLEYELPQGCEFAMRTGASHLPWTIALPSPVCSGSLLSGSSMQVPSQRALSVTQEALSVTQRSSPSS